MGHVHDIIAIGASSGGVQALQELVSGLPPDLPAAVFVALHTAPRHPSHQGERLPLESLALEQAEEVERALWAAPRALEESASILRRAGESAGSDELRRRLAERRRRSFTTPAWSARRPRGPRGAAQRQAALLPDVPGIRSVASP